MLQVHTDLDVTAASRGKKTGCRRPMRAASEQVYSRGKQTGCRRRRHFQQSFVFQGFFCSVVHVEGVETCRVLAPAESPKQAEWWLTPDPDPDESAGFCPPCLGRPPLSGSGCGFRSVLSACQKMLQCQVLSVTKYSTPCFDQRRKMPARCWLDADIRNMLMPARCWHDAFLFKWFHCRFLFNGLMLARCLFKLLARCWHDAFLSAWFRCRAVWRAAPETLAIVGGAAPRQQCTQLKMRQMALPRASLPRSQTRLRQSIVLVRVQLGDSPANLLYQPTCYGHTTRAPSRVPHNRASFEPGTSRFSTLRMNHYATRASAFVADTRASALVFRVTGFSAFVFQAAAAGWPGLRRPQRANA